jgi:hypothetical protein
MTVDKMEIPKEDLSKPILIKDLDMLYPTENSKRKYRFGLYKCGFWFYFRRFGACGYLFPFPFTCFL